MAEAPVLPVQINFYTRSSMACSGAKRAASLGFGRDAAHERLHDRPRRNQCSQKGEVRPDFHAADNC